MKKIDVGQTIGILANVGVIAGIIFLAVEVQQNTDAIRSATIQDVSHRSYESSVLNVENADLREAWIASCDGRLTRNQRLQLLSYYSAALKIHMNRYYQSEYGIMDEDALIALGGEGGVFSLPVFSELWPGARSEFAPEFQEYVERRLLPMLDKDFCTRFFAGSSDSE